MDFFEKVKWMQLAYASALIILGYLFSRWISYRSERLLAKRVSKHQAMLMRRLIFYVLFLLFFISALNQLGFKLSVLLGAAGIFTVAIGFASQTAASNLVSGIFLLFEQPFKAGDLIQVNNLTGTVDSIDLLSTKIKTADSLLIRLPNEALIKSNITNLSYFPTRRFDIVIGISYDCPVDTAKSLLLQLATRHEKILESPEPKVIIENFADSSVELKLLAWTKNADNFATKNELKEWIKAEFDKENIEIPFPQMTLHQSS